MSVYEPLSAFGVTKGPLRVSMFGLLRDNYAWTQGCSG